MFYRIAVLGAFSAGLLTACADAPTAIPTNAIGPPALSRSEGTGVFQRYVAIGTSVSMGTESDGLIGDFQQVSWPAQLSRMARRDMTLPLIASPGCRSPLIAPLSTGVRLSGESAATAPADLSCAPNVRGVTLPTQNVAINAATTNDALVTTPENVTDPANAQLYHRVLAAGQTQVSAMIARNPKLVSVELGANDVFGARTGVYIPGRTVVPVSAWETAYLDVLDNVGAASRQALLVGLIDDAVHFPGFRRGGEIWDGRATLAPFHVVVSEDCQDSRNVLFVPVRVPLAVGEGAARARAGAPPAVLSCANAPSSSGIEDYVLAPEEIDALNTQLGQMNAIIRREAARRGYAYFALGELYDRTVTKPPFNAVTLMTTAEPYGPYISLDGVHPSAPGHQVLARAAAQALNARYRYGIPLEVNVVAFAFHPSP